MPTAHIATPDEARILRDVVNDFRKRPKGKGVPNDPDKSHQTPDVYVVKPPCTGIPARSGEVPGHAKCVIYRLDPFVTGDPALEQMTGLCQKVYNLFPARVYDPFILVERDAYGDLYVASRPTTTTGPTVNPDTTEDPNNPYGSVPPCEGRGRWSWTNAQNYWTLEEDECEVATTTEEPTGTGTGTGEATTTTTEEPCDPCAEDEEEETGTATSSATSSGTGTGTATGCKPAYPDFCGTEDFQCTFTFCIPEDVQSAPDGLECVPTTEEPDTGTGTGTGTGTSNCDECSSTTEDPDEECECGDGCCWHCTPVNGWSWKKHTDTCNQYTIGDCIVYTCCLPCPYPTIPCNETVCAPTTTGCKNTVSKITCPGKCNGSCKWWGYKYTDCDGNAVVSPWIYINGNCSLNTPCFCVPPSSPPSKCGYVFTACKPPEPPEVDCETMTYPEECCNSLEPCEKDCCGNKIDPNCVECQTDPCDDCTTTEEPTTEEPNECGPGCRWRGDGDGGWTKLTDQCLGDCSCQKPPYDSEDECHTVVTECLDEPEVPCVTCDDCEDPAEAKTMWLHDADGSWSVCSSHSICQSAGPNPDEVGPGDPPADNETCACIEGNCIAWYCTGQDGTASPLCSLESITVPSGEILSGPYESEAACEEAGCEETTTCEPCQDDPDYCESGGKAQWICENGEFTFCEGSSSCHEGADPTPPSAYYIGLCADGEFDCGKICTDCTTTCEPGEFPNTGTGTGACEEGDGTPLYQCIRVDFASGPEWQWRCVNTNGCDEIELDHLGAGLEPDGYPVGHCMESEECDVACLACPTTTEEPVACDGDSCCLICDLGVWTVRPVGSGQNCEDVCAPACFCSGYHEATATWVIVGDDCTGYNSHSASGTCEPTTEEP